MNSLNQEQNKLSEMLNSLMEKLSYEDFLEITDFEKHPLTDEENANLNSKKVMEAAYHLGQIGVIIPAHMKKEDIYMIAMIQATIDTADEPFRSLSDPESIISREEFKDEIIEDIFKYLYGSQTSWYFDDLQNQILNDTKHDDLLHGRVSQTFNAFDDGLYFPCVCSLLSLIEGELGKATSSGSTKLYELTNNIVNKGDDASQIACENLKGFISELAKSAHFTKDPEPPRLNRHWLMHGRSHKETGKYDCIRLFCIFQIIIELSLLPSEQEE